MSEQFDRFEWMNAWVDDPEIPGEVMGTLAVILRHARRGDGLAWTSQKTIAEKTGKSSRTVRRHLKSESTQRYIEMVGEGHARKEYLPKMPENRSDTHVRGSDTDGRQSDTGVRVGGGHSCPTGRTSAPGGRTPMSGMSDTDVRQTDHITDHLTDHEQTNSPADESTPTPTPGREDGSDLDPSATPPVDHHDRDPVPEPERMDPMMYKQRLRRCTGRNWHPSQINRDRMRHVLAYWTKPEIEEALKITRTKADRPGWGFFSAVLESIADGSQGSTGANNQRVAITENAAQIREFARRAEENTDVTKLFENADPDGRFDDDDIPF